LFGILGWLDTRNKDCTEERKAFERAKAELQGTRRSYAARKSELRALLLNVNALGYTTTLDRTPWSNELPKDAKMPPELAGLVVEAASEMRAAEERFRAAGEVAIGALQELERCEGRPIMPHDPALALILASLPEGDLLRREARTQLPSSGHRTMRAGRPTP